MQKLCLLDNKISLVKIRGHSAFLGNDRADFLAKLGSRGDGIYYDLPRPIEVFKEAIKSRTLLLWNEQWSKGIDCRQTKLWLPQILSTSPSVLWNMSRWDLSHCVQLISGHCYYAKHRYLLGENIDPTCRICGQDDETPSHLALSCTPLRNRQANSRLSPTRWSFGSILQFFEDDMLLQYQYV